MQSQVTKRFLTKKELAERLNLSVYTIDAWVIHKEHIPFIKMGRRVMFDLRDVEAWVERNRVAPKTR